MKKMFSAQAGYIGMAGVGLFLLMSGGSFFYTGNQRVTQSISDTTP